MPLQCLCLCLCVVAVPLMSARGALLFCFAVCSQLASSVPLCLRCTSLCRRAAYVYIESSGRWEKNRARAQLIKENAKNDGPPQRRSANDLRKSLLVGGERLTLCRAVDVKFSSTSRTTHFQHFFFSYFFFFSSLLLLLGSHRPVVQAKYYARRLRPAAVLPHRDRIVSRCDALLRPIDLLPLPLRTICID